MGSKSWVLGNLESPDSPRVSRNNIDSRREIKFLSSCEKISSMRSLFWGQLTLIDFLNLVLVSPIFHVAFPCCSRVFGHKRATCMLMGELLESLSVVAGPVSIPWEGVKICSISPFPSLLPLLSSLCSSFSLSWSFNCRLRLSTFLQIVSYDKDIILLTDVLNGFASFLPPFQTERFLLTLKMGNGGVCVMVTWKRNFLKIKR